MRFSPLFVLFLAAVLSRAWASWKISPHDGSYSTPPAKQDIPAFTPPNREGFAGQLFQLNFTHGVSASDPNPDSVSLRTSVSLVPAGKRFRNPDRPPVPRHVSHRGPPVKSLAAPVCLDYCVSIDAQLRDVSHCGRVWGLPEFNYAVRVDALHLRPSTAYWYRFNICNSTVISPVGQFNTTRAATGYGVDEEFAALPAHPSTSNEAAENNNNNDGGGGGGGLRGGPRR
ncbi:MAG: hypothetical protein M1826_004208 [Phylliscum demangeonii]|nr:MAG: hypothetical protein M1826_004208 [Phylliscum demangeonii]